SNDDGHDRATIASAIQQRRPPVAAPGPSSFEARPQRAVEPLRETDKGGHSLRRRAKGMHLRHLWEKTSPMEKTSSLAKTSLMERRHLWRQANKQRPSS